MGLPEKPFFEGTERNCDTRVMPVLRAQRFRLSNPEHGRFNPVTDEFTEIDWNTWIPSDRATLCFVIREDEILLIRKKRGLGAGKINGPGGRIEPGETPAECAVREVQEELGVTPTGLDECGELRFQFTDGYAIEVHVFTATSCIGEAIETEEAIPMWTSTNNIPYAEMWEDDIIWIPWMLNSQRFSGRFLFDGDRMVGNESGVLVPSPNPEVRADTGEN